jgi:hypothetical protein
MENEILWLLVPLFGLIALLYGSVGLGGASSYVAVLALAGLGHTSIPVIALALSLLVAGGGVVQFARGGHMRWKNLFAIAVTSVPAAFVAAQVPLERDTFQMLLGALLVLAGMRMVSAPWLRPKTESFRRAPAWLLALLGLALGTAAGLSGIGGGIYLAPALLLWRLATPKQAAALAGGIVVLNSAAGLSGQLVRGAAMPWELFVPLAITVLVFGQLGAFLGSSRLRPSWVQAGFGALVLVVATRLVIVGFG